MHANDFYVKHFYEFGWRLYYQHFCTPVQKYHTDQCYKYVHQNNANVMYVINHFISTQSVFKSLFKKT